MGWSDETSDGRDRSGERDDGAREIVHGVDFSGARDAGRKTWIASGVIGDGLRIERCYQLIQGESPPLQRWDESGKE